MQIIQNIKERLSTLSFRSGIVVACVCVICYAISFAQILLPISTGAKSALWVIFFGLAKTAQYTALLIFGKEGVTRLKAYFRHTQSSQ